MDLTDLESIIIPEDYKQELFEFQKQNGLYVGYTESDMGTGHAMAVTYKNNDREKKIIFFNKILTFAFVDDNYLNNLEDDTKDDLTALRKSAINFMQHELVHVHEFSILRRIFAIAKAFPTADILTSDLRTLAQMV